MNYYTFQFHATYIYALDCIYVYVFIFSSALSHPLTLYCYLPNTMAKPVTNTTWSRATSRELINTRAPARASKMAEPDTHTHPTTVTLGAHAPRVN